MKKILSMMAALMIVGGVAMAQGNSADNRNNEGQGIQCGDGALVVENPGQGFQLYTDEGFTYYGGETPDEVAETVMGGDASVGDFINRYCGTPDGE